MQITERDILDVKRKSGFRDSALDAEQTAEDLLDVLGMRVSTEKRVEIKLRLNSIYTNLMLEETAYTPSTLYVPRKEKDRPKKLQTIISRELEHLAQLSNAGALALDILNDLHDATVDLMRSELGHCKWSQVISDENTFITVMDELLDNLDVPRRSSRDSAVEYAVISALGQLYYDLSATVPKRSHDHAMGEGGVFLEFVRIFFAGAGYPVHGKFSATVRRYIETDAQKLAGGKTAIK